MNETNEIIKLADSLGVSDIRVIPAAQQSNILDVNIDEEYYKKYKILDYRINRMKNGKLIRGLIDIDSHRCGLVLDDIAICENHHYPCIIYMRESGKPIGKVSGNMRKEREEWFLNHDTHCDKICRENCLDVCVDYNNLFDRCNLHY